MGVKAACRAGTASSDGRAGVTLLSLAIQSADGLVIDHYYKEGLAINQLIHRDRAAVDLGYRAQAVLSNDRSNIRIFVSSASGAPLPAALRMRARPPRSRGQGPDNFDDGSAERLHVLSNLLWAAVGINRSIGGGRTALLRTSGMKSTSTWLLPKGSIFTMPSVTRCKRSAVRTSGPTADCNPSSLTPR